MSEEIQVPFAIGIDVFFAGPVATECQVDDLFQEVSIWNSGPASFARDIYGGTPTILKSRKYVSMSQFEPPPNSPAVAPQVLGSGCFDKTFANSVESRGKNH